MSFNLFGAATTNDIRLGYIDSERGYVKGVTIAEANKYASLNPGSIFILETRDRTRYLTINEVNALTPEDILPSDSAATSTCDGVQGLRPDDLILDEGDVLIGTGGGGTGPGGSSGSNNAFKKAYPVILKITGGGGVGAVGNPIFGRDGSLLAVDVVRGGFGYKTAPQVKLVDDRGRGSGAVLKAFVGTAVSFVQYYDSEEDFEEYIFGPELPGYGNTFDANGNRTGSWDPTLFASLRRDPIGQQIKQFQEFLAQNASGPFWTTRKEAPLKVSFRNQTNRTVFDVTHPAWNDEFMNQYAVSPVSMSNVPGSDFAGRVCTFEWEEDFPFGGTYTFNGMCDNDCKVYLDNSEIMNINIFKGAPNTVSIPLTKGVHQIKVDLVNTPTTQKNREPVQLNNEPAGTTGTGLNISYRGLNTANKRLDVKDGNRVNLKDGAGNDINGVLRIKSSTVNAKFSDDGKKILYDGNGSINIQYSWDDNPNTAGQAVDSIEIGGKIIKQRGASGKKTITVEVTGVNSTPPNGSSSLSRTNNNGVIFDTVNAMNSANRRLWRTNVYGSGSFLNEYGVCPFDTRKPLEDNPYAGTHRIQWDNIEVPADGNYNIEVEVDDSVELTVVESIKETTGSGGEAIVINKKGFNPNGKSSGKSSYKKLLRKGKHKIIADLVQEPGGRFSFDSGSTAKKSTINARFRRVGGGYEMIVQGSGTADIDFSLRMDDATGVSGSSLSQVKIGTGRESVTLKRSRTATGYKEKEVITGTATFEAGKTYPITISGQSTRAGVQLSPSGSLLFDDNATNGFDINGELKLIRVKNIKPASVKGINPMALAIRITSDDFADNTSFISTTSWEENPMGVALTIEAPIPEPPQEPPIVSEGRCPNNPIWSTRSSNSSTRWYPVNDSRWSDFTNRFALSPIPPRAEQGTDGAGVKYINSWDINIPYRGYYGLKGTADNQGRILVDGTEVYQLEGFKSTSPSTNKILLEQGPHTITVEVSNFDAQNYNTIRKKVFSTKDWGSSSGVVADLTEGAVDISYRGLNAANKRLTVRGNTVKLKDGAGDDTNATFAIKSSTNNARFSDDGKKILYDGNGNITVKLTWDDNPNTAGQAVNSIEIGGVVLYQRGTSGNDTKTFSTYNVAPQVSTQGVTYEGPPVSKTKNSRWSTWMNDHNITPIVDDDDDGGGGGSALTGLLGSGSETSGSESSENSETRTFIWKNVNFFENGTYNIEMMASNNAVLYIDDKLATDTRSYIGGPTSAFVNLTQGSYDIRVELEDTVTQSEFPASVALKISKDIVISTNSQSWQDNPVAASAILIPPPCPKVISGRGVVTRIVADEPGQGYPQPPGDGYPVTLQLVEVIPSAKGINYSIDDVVLVNGEPLTPKLGPFGTVESIPVNKPLIGYTEYPNITMPSDTGIGFRGRPVFKPIIVPEDFEDILQVTDLVGLKQTGYVNGKPYYGQVFIKEGVRYAGISETIGELIPVYATLQESIDAEITTAPSAIPRQGTDVTNNDPRLNIPGTPDNLV